MSARIVTGCDVVDVDRLATALARTPALRDRVFTPGEQAAAVRGGVAPDSRRAHERLAARFAAKEATRKALGDLRLPFHATEVVTDAAGAPALHLHGAPSGLALSLAHDGGVAMAVVTGLVHAPVTADPTARHATTGA
ncbi:MAG: holo-ACP synthase [Actinomycetes bacterium]